MMRVTLLAALAAAASWACPASAEFAKGKDAFDHGNYNLAYTELMEDAQTGNAEAEFMIGEMAAGGLGTPRSYALAAQWYRLAAAKGYEPASLALGLLYLRGAGNDDDPSRVAADPAAAVAYLKAAADAGDSSAQSLMGQLYMTGTGVERDSSLARRYTLKAAERGVVEAEFNAGLLILRNAGTAPDLANAYKWFSLAARQGYPGADENRRYVMARMSPGELQRGEALVAAFQPAP